jgi:transposase-like protein
VGRPKLDQAWAETDYEKARTALTSLAKSLEDKYPGAAASLREGLDEILTVLRLELPEALRKTLRSTNPIESAFDKVRMASRNVKRWRNGQQVLRWTAAGPLEAEKGFRRIKGDRIQAFRQAIGTAIWRAKEAGIQQGAWDLCFQYVHLTNNRLGILPVEEAYLAQLVETVAWPVD